jgi:indolepyruvate ferredoxin oxidoreductase beta subunit
VKPLPKDPLNILVADVGGQGNVMLAQIMGQALVMEGFFAVVGDTFGAAQRGGPVAIDIRVSKDTEYSSIVPKGQADFILGMEPSETLRVMGAYANPNTRVIVNPRVVLPPTVISGADTYPDFDEVLAAIKKHSSRLWIVNATEEALKLGNSIYTNVILPSALLGSNTLPLDKEKNGVVLKEELLKAFDMKMVALQRGLDLVRL